MDFPELLKDPQLKKSDQDYETSQTRDCKSFSPPLILLVDWSWLFWILPGKVWQLSGPLWSTSNVCQGMGGEHLQCKQPHREVEGVSNTMKREGVWIITVLRQRHKLEFFRAEGMYGHPRHADYGRRRLMGLHQGCPAGKCRVSSGLNSPSVVPQGYH